MKRKINLLFVGILVFSSLLFTISCSKGGDNNANPVKKSFVSASVTIENGTSFTFSKNKLNAGASVEENDTLLIIFSDQKNSTIISFSVWPVNGTGSYTLSDPDTPNSANPLCISSMILNGNNSSIANTYFSGTDLNGDGKPEGTGTLKISSLTSKEIKGTFSMTMYNFQMNKAVVSNGKFSCILLHR